MEFRDKLVRDKKVQYMHTWRRYLLNWFSLGRYGSGPGITETKNCDPGTPSGML